MGALPARAPARVVAVQRSTVGAKQTHESVGSSTLEDLADVPAPALFSGIIRLHARMRFGERLRPAINLIVSNVPEPSSAALVALGAAVIGAARRRRRAT